MAEKRAQGCPTLTDENLFPKDDRCDLMVKASTPKEWDERSLIIQESREAEMKKNQKKREEESQQQ